MYLAVFRLGELGVDHFQSMVLAVNEHVKMTKLMAFLTNEAHFTTWVHDEWVCVYERAHVEATYLNPFLKNQPLLHGVIEALGQHLRDGINSTTAAKTTTPEPFNLTLPKPREVPIPEPIAAIPKPNSVPKTTYSTPIGKRA